MKDVSEFFVWIWHLVLSAIYYVQQGIYWSWTAIKGLYFSAFQYMSSEPAFSSVPYLGKVMLSSIFAAVVPIILFALIRAFLPMLVRAHIQEAFGTSVSTSRLGSSSTNDVVAQQRSSLRPIVTFDDPNVHVSRLRKGMGGSWTAEIKKGNQRRTINIGQASYLGRLNISTFGSNGTVEWGD